MQSIIVFNRNNVKTTTYEIYFDKYKVPHFNAMVKLVLF